MTEGTAAHWDRAYGHGAATRSWFETEAAGSLRMLDAAGVTPQDGVLDVGAGASPLVDALLERGHTDLTVLDISAAGLRTAQDRLGEAADRVAWVVADLLTWQPDRSFAVWHDRAVLHFLADPDSLDRYRRLLLTATRPGAVATIAAFAPDGPEQCSGLPITRYDATGLVELFGTAWRLLAEARELHTTPTGGVQPFTWVALRRTA